MSQVPIIRSTPWDTEAFGIPAWELLEYSEAALQITLRTKGHFTLKVDPLEDKGLLHEYGFYYCDTLIEPTCSATQLRPARHPDAVVSREVNAEQAKMICHGAFTHGRFHRDFKLSRTAANQRYDIWLDQLLEAQQVFGLYWQGSLAGFIGYRDDSLVLHAVAEAYRGKGLAKYWWSAASLEILASGNTLVKSSISVTNLAVLNLYASLGFRFNSPVDAYHLMVL